MANDTGLGNYASQALLSAVLGTTSNFGALTSRAAWYLGLSSTAASGTGGNVNEPSGGSYARLATSAANYSSATNADPSQATNIGTLSFPAATADWLSQSLIVCVPIYDAAAAGNYLGVGSLTVPKPVFNGDTFQIGSGQMVITLT